MESLRSQQLRIGFNYIPNFVGYNGKEFEGFFSSICEVIHDWTEARGLNRTLIPSSDGFGRFNKTTGNYTGVLGMLQRNEADMVFDPNIDFNLVQGNGVTRGQLIECEPPAIISGYSSKTRMTTVDILIDTSRDIGYWNLFLFMNAFALLTFLLSRNQRLKREYRSIISVIFYIMQKIPIKTYNLRTVLISVTLSVTLIYLMLTFSCLLHVSLVKVDPPLVINDYNDIIDRLDDALKHGGQFRVAWSWEYPDTELFRRGEPESKEALIWSKNVQNGGPDFVKLGADMSRADKKIKNQTMVVILNKGYAYFVRHCLCTFNDANINFHSWISVDKDAKWNQKGYVIRESFSGPLRSWVDRRMQRVIESGLMIYSYRLLVGLKFPLFQYSRKNCSSDTIVMENYHDNTDTKLSNQQFAVTYYICAFLSILAVIALTMEHRLFRYGINIKVVNVHKLPEK